MPPLLRRVARIANDYLRALLTSSAMLRAAYLRSVPINSHQYSFANIIALTNLALFISPQRLSVLDLRAEMILSQDRIRPPVQSMKG